MPDIQIKIKNLPQIKRAFAMAPQIMAKELNISIREALIIIERQSRINAPVAKPWTWKRPVKGYVGGRLRASHYVKFSNLKGEVGTKVEYDHWVHDGTKYMVARPYLKKAVDANEHNTDRLFLRAVTNTLEKIGKAT